MLRRKIRRVGSSLVVSMPTHLLEVLDIQDQDHVIITIIDKKTIGIQKYIKKGDK